MAPPYTREQTDRALSTSGFETRQFLDRGLTHLFRVGPRGRARANHPRRCRCRDGRWGRRISRVPVAPVLVVVIVLASGRRCDFTHHTFEKDALRHGRGIRVLIKKAGAAAETICGISLFAGMIVRHCI